MLSQLNLTGKEVTSMTGSLVWIMDCILKRVDRLAIRHRRQPGLARPRNLVAAHSSKHDFIVKIVPKCVMDPTRGNGDVISAWPGKIHFDNASRTIES
jgi:hypothetical protein